MLPEPVGLFLLGGVALGMTIQVHYFLCVSGWDWWLTEYDSATGEAFGLVRGLAEKWGYFSIPEMEGLNRSKGFGVDERDEHFGPVPVSKVR